MLRGYAEAHVSAGNWTPEESLQRAEAETRALLPDGLSTDKMLFLTALDESGSQVGHVWVCLEHPRGLVDCAWIYDIEVKEDRRGEGLGRSLLAAAEAAVRAHGVGAIMLNVFGHDGPAVNLYEGSGYITMSQQMRKALRRV
jgi:GNAT superfamily N-acetyltransferase